MDGKCFVIVFLLFVRYSISQNCDCKLVDILQNILQREMLERAKLESRVEMLESKLGSLTNNVANSSQHISDKVILERLSAIETIIETFNETSADIQKNISDNKKRLSHLTNEVELKVDLLINQTNDMVFKQLKHVEDTFEVIRLGINKTVEDYTALMDKDFIVFINQTDSTRNSFRTDGNWTEWEEWSRCSVSCGIGMKRRERTCSRNSIYFQSCVGDDNQSELCGHTPCQANNGGWDNWSSWSSCSATCGVALMTRTRTCTQPAPIQFGLSCIGNSEDKQICGNFNKPCGENREIIDGPSAFEGRLEVYYNGQWGTVCDDSFTNSGARVVCKMLGFPWYYAVEHHDAYYGQGTLPILVDEVTCLGTESSIFECSHAAWYKPDCHHGEDVGVSCRG